MRTFFALTLLGALILGCTPTPEHKDSSITQVTGPDDVEVGRYLVAVGGCNDCHTPGFAANAGHVPEARRLQGNPVGYRGPWGVTYASNLRLTVTHVDEEAWVSMLKTRSSSPPMSWPSVHAMTEDNQRAVYRYIRSLGAAGQPAPTNLPPGEEPNTPYVDFRPVRPKSPAVW